MEVTLKNLFDLHLKMETSEEYIWGTIKNCSIKRIYKIVQKTAPDPEGIRYNEISQISDGVTSEVNASIRTYQIREGYDYPHANGDHGTDKSISLTGITGLHPCWWAKRLKSMIP